MVDILLSEGVDEIVIRQAGDRDDRGTVDLGIIQAIEQVDAARPCSRQAAAEFTGPARRIPHDAPE